MVSCLFAVLTVGCAVRLCAMPSVCIDLHNAINLRSGQDVGKCWLPLLTACEYICDIGHVDNCQLLRQLSRWRNMHQCTARHMHL